MEAILDTASPPQVLLPDAQPFHSTTRLLNFSDAIVQTLQFTEAETVQGVEPFPGDPFQEIGIDCMCSVCISRRQCGPGQNIDFQCPTCFGYLEPSSQCQENCVAPQFLDPIATSTQTEQNFEENVTMNYQPTSSAPIGMWEIVDASFLGDPDEALESSIEPTEDDVQLDDNLGIDLDENPQPDSTGSKSENVEASSDYTRPVTSSTLKLEPFDEVFGRQRSKMYRRKWKYVREVPPCTICGQPSSGKHYGTVACEGCKGFFRRVVMKHCKYRCKNNEACAIDQTLRRRCCKACRYIRCLQAGMRAEACRNFVKSDRA